MRQFCFDYVILASEGDKDLVQAHCDSITATRGPSEIWLLDKSNEGIPMEFTGGQLYHVRVPVFRQKSIGPLSQHGYDVADGYHRAMTECGSKRWCMVVHADVKILDPNFWPSITEMVESGVPSVLGDCRCILLMDREVYRTTHFGFWPISSMFGERMPHRDGIWLRRLAYPMIHEEIHVDGLDVGDLLLMEVAHYHHRVQPISQLNSMFFHIGAGSAYVDTKDSNFAATQAEKRKRFLS